MALDASTPHLLPVTQSEDVPLFADLPAVAVQLVLGSAEAKAGVRLASCSKPLLAEAKRCQALWKHVLYYGYSNPRNHRVLAAAVKALSAPEVPALGSFLLGCVGEAAVSVEAFGGLHETLDAQWEAGRKAAERFEQVPEAQWELLYWLVVNAPHLPGIEGVEYAVSVMKRFSQDEEDEDVQFWGCRALHHLCHHHPALRERAGELDAVEVLVSALDRFAASHQFLRSHGVAALRRLTDEHATNAARLEAAGGSHYLQAQDDSTDENEDEDEDDDDEEEGEEFEEEEEDEEEYEENDEEDEEEV